MTFGSIIALAVPTNRTIHGPKLIMSASTLTVEYDYEGDTGSLKWVKILFEETLVFEFRDSACCRSDDLIGSTEIRCQARSNYLKSVILKWQESVGWQDWQQEKGGAERFKHFTIYFDDSASLNVVASACRVDADPTSSGACGSESDGDTRLNIK